MNMYDYNGVTATCSRELNLGSIFKAGQNPALNMKNKQEIERASSTVPSNS